MNGEQELRTKPSTTWIAVGYFGLVLTILLSIGKAIVDIFIEGHPENALGSAFVTAVMVGIPSAVITLIFWISRYRRQPSGAMVVMLWIGINLLIFSSFYLIGGLSERPIEWTAVIGGLMPVLKLTLPFFFMAWLLWVRPKIGAILLVCIGIGLGVWMYLGWNLGDMNLINVILPASLAAIPIILGLDTLINELKRDKQDNHAAGSA